MAINDAAAAGSPAVRRRTTRHPGSGSPTRSPGDDVTAPDATGLLTPAAGEADGRADDTAAPHPPGAVGADVSCALRQDGPRDESADLHEAALRRGGGSTTEPRDEGSLRMRWSVPLT